MGTYTKIKVIMLYTLNNAEYLAYMNSVLALLPPHRAARKTVRMNSLWTKKFKNQEPPTSVFPKSLSMPRKKNVS